MRENDAREEVKIGKERMERGGFASSLKTGKKDKQDETITEGKAEGLSIRSVSNSVRRLSRPQVPRCQRLCAARE